MASIIRKKIKKHTYYYYVESKRVNGKPTLVNQKYLGTAESISKKISLTSKIPEPLYSIVLDFADISLLYDLALRLNVVDTINKHSKKREQGISIGDYILLAAINRAVAPASKSEMAHWFSKTVLSRLLPIDAKHLTSQNFWNHMCLTDDDISRIEDDLVVSIVHNYNIDTSHLIYDATNFFSYISTKQKSALAKRGHSKEKRSDLRIVGLSMMISPDCNIPLLYDTYPGNKPDSKQFNVMLSKLKQRYEKLLNKSADVTIIFDRGNNHQDNIDLLENEDFPLYYVGGLKKNQCADLFGIEKSKYTQLAGECFERVTAFRTTKYVYERDMTVVVTFNQNLYDGQMQGILFNMEKTYDNLSTIQKQLIKRAEGIVTKGRKPTAASVEKQVKAALKLEYMDDIFDYELTTLNGIPFVKFILNETKLLHLQKTILGKTVLFTNRHEWSTEQIVASYRSAWHIENAFSQLKDTDHLTVRPFFHWTDQKIKVHIYYCVLAYRLCCILKKELLLHGIDESINKILEHLNELKYIITVLGTSKSDILCSFSQASNMAEKIATHYNLKNKYLPVR
ncbi:MAG: IS1634 family transposase [Treponema sp.]|jgi:transposase|nr:IS1634 family transposase [Treponema sp.]